MPRRGKINITGNSNSKRKRNDRLNETPDETNERRRRSSENARGRDSNESLDQRNSRLQSKSVARTLYTEHETEEQRRDRLNRRAINRAKSLQRTRSNAVVTEVDETLSMYAQDDQGEMSYSCHFCSAKFFKAEKPSDGLYSSCCHKGKIYLPSLLCSGELIATLLKGEHVKSAHFMQNIRAFNSSLAFASFGAKIKEPTGRGPYVFRIHGQIYHRTSQSSTPVAGDEARFAQLYILDADDANEVRQSQSDKYNLNLDLLKALDTELRSVNPFAQAYKMLSELEKDVNSSGGTHQVTLSICRSPNFDPRRYNAPCVNEVALIFENANGEPPFERDIRVHYRDPRPPKQISILNANLDPMVYPIIFPKGDIGWSPDLKHKNSTNRMSQLQYYSYRLSVRDRFNPVLSCGKLTQQYIVDAYAKIEANRLNFIRQNQKHLRVEMYKGLYDYVHGESDNTRPGVPVILPSSFIGSPRAMSQNYQDSMAIVAKFGKPDLFITMTCNPNWVEISNNLHPWDTVQNRPDLVSRVFEMKKKALLDDIGRGVLGIPIANIHVIEFQKRGLPHMHLLIILRPEDKPSTSEKIDQIVWAEIPDANKNPRLRELVLKHMIHGPCGVYCPHSPCMADNVCTKDFPKSFQETTDADVNGYPLYRRRSQFSSQSDCLKRGTMINNSWVVPYNPYLLLKYNCHINVEVCASIKGVKYLFKYVYKGHDCAHVSVNECTENTHQRDELKYYVDSRYLSPPECMWRILENKMYNHSHCIIRLAVHLDKEQPVYFNEGEEERSLIAVARRNTTLTDWFALNARDSNAKKYLYYQIPNHYVFNKQWTPRKQGGDQVIGRMYSVSPIEGERYFLRLLLLHVRGAVSYENLQCVDGVQYSSFRETAEALGLLASDDEWHKCMQEASLIRMPSQLRELFGNICIFCTPKDPLNLYEIYKKDMAEEYLAKYTEEIAFNLCLLDINSVLSCHGKSLKDFNLPQANDIDECLLTSYIGSHMEEEIGNAMLQKLTIDQRAVFDEIMRSVEDPEYKQRLHFLDGVGGSGKTFLYNTLIHVLRGQSKSVSAVASTGIASNLLLGGRTYFSEFGLPVPLLDTSVSRIKANTSAGKRLISVKLIIWDEVTMAKNIALDAVDRCLRDLKVSTQPFGGVTVLLGGDFRQTLPVVRHGSRVNIIESTIKFCKLWPKFKKHSLLLNKRAESDYEFSEWLLNLGNSTLENYPNSESIEIPNDMVESGSIVQAIFGYQINVNNVKELAERAILCPKNNDVDQLNRDVEGLLDGTSTSLFSEDSIDSEDQSDHVNIPVEFIKFHNTVWNASSRACT